MSHPSIIADREFVSAGWHYSIDEERGVCEQLPADFSPAPSFLPAAESVSIPPSVPPPSYASRLFSNDGASGAPPMIDGSGGAAGAGSRLEATAAADESILSSGLKILVGLLGIFNMAGCGPTDEKINPAPTVPCTPKDQLDGGVLPDGGGGEGGSSQAWICPDDPPYTDPNPGSGCDDQGNCWGSPAPTD
ncbi:MAG: hypothetical protein U1F57_09960 [bacterium]